MPCNFKSSTHNFMFYGVKMGLDSILYSGWEFNFWLRQSFFTPVCYGGGSLQLLKTSMGRVPFPISSFGKTILTPLCIVHLLISVMHWPPPLYLKLAKIWRKSIHVDARERPTKPNKVWVSPLKLIGRPNNHKFIQSYVGKGNIRLKLLVACISNLYICYYTIIVVLLFLKRVHITRCFLL
jgi:hypothetical protein